MSDAMKGPVRNRVNRAMKRPMNDTPKGLPESPAKAMAPIDVPADNSPEDDRSGWRTAWASVTGTAHTAHGNSGDDACGCIVFTDATGSEVAVAVAADGAGSARFAARGAATAIQATLALIGYQTARQTGTAWFGPETAKLLVAAVASAIHDRAEAEGEGTPADYATTLVAVIAGEDGVSAVQCGDGLAIASAAGQGPVCIIAPQAKEYANETAFVTDCSPILRCGRIEGRITACAVTTDGLEAMIVDRASGAVHAPSIQGILTWVAELEPWQGGPSAEINEWLRSGPVTDRTDDDVTLAIVARSDHE